MIFKLNIDPKCTEEVVANVHERTPLVDEIEKLVTSDKESDYITGYLEDEIKMLPISDVECFYVESDKTYAVYGKDRFVVKKRLYEIEQTLPADYIRINKSAIANKTKIAKFKVLLSGAVDAQFKSGYTDYVSRRCFADIKRRYGI